MSWWAWLLWATTVAVTTVVAVYDVRTRRLVDRALRHIERRGIDS